MPFAGLALRFGAPEMLPILLLTFSTFVGLGGESPFKTVVPVAILFAFGLYRGLEGFFRVFMPKSMFYGDSFPL